MLIWQKDIKGIVKVRILKNTSYVWVKREKMQRAVSETINKVHNTREDFQELNIVYGWLIGLKAITLNQLNGKNNIEFYFNDESIWRHEPEVILTDWDELFDAFIKVVRSCEKRKKV